MYLVCCGALSLSNSLPMWRAFLSGGPVIDILVFEKNLVVLPQLLTLATVKASLSAVQDKGLLAHKVNQPF